MAGKALAKPVEARPVGRPSKYTKRLADRICAELAMGKSLRTVSKAVGIEIETIYRWIRTKSEFQERYAQSKQDAADSMAEEILDIADNGTNDWMTFNGHRVTNREAIERSKLRVDTRKFLMAKMKPKKYGEKLDIDARVSQVKPILDGIAKKQNAPEAVLVAAPHLLQDVND
jgi:transposase